MKIHQSKYGVVSLEIEPDEGLSLQDGFVKVTEWNLTTSGITAQEGWIRFPPGWSLELQTEDGNLNVLN